MSRPVEPPRYPYVHLDVSADEVDDVSAELFELGATGVEERDDATLARGPGAGRARLVASFPDRALADDACRALEDRAPWVEEVVGDAWRDAWKEHFEPFSLTPTLTVRPPWRAHTPTRPGERVLELEPGRAFGTGLHATTALVASVLDDAAEEGRYPLAARRVLDVGTGSGILALVALVCGAAHVDAFDNDADVIDVVRENAERNGLGDRLRVWHGTLDALVRSKVAGAGGPRVELGYDWVLANIETRILATLAADLARVVRPGGRLVLSGVLDREHDALLSRFVELPGATLHHVETRRERDLPASLRPADAPPDDPDTWVAIVLERS